jgi:hypothetical protein
MTRLPDHVVKLERVLRGIFATRLESLVAYDLHETMIAPGGSSHGDHGAASTAHTLVVVKSLTESDLKSCADLVAAWHDAGLATPLLLTTGEFERSLDAFPLEFGAIIADHIVVAGRDPFEGLVVDAADLRRACEVQARSHLLHLRHGFLETNGRGDAIAVLIVRSAAPFAALLASVARLQGAGAGDRAAAGRHAERVLELPPGAVTEVTRLAHAAEISAADAVRIFPKYLDAVERLVQYVDRWGGQ